MIVEDQYGVGDLVDVGPVDRDRGGGGPAGHPDPRPNVASSGTSATARSCAWPTSPRAGRWPRPCIPVSYDADLEEIRQVVVEVGNDMYNDPETRERMLGRPTFAGVEAVSGEAIYVRIIGQGSGVASRCPLTRELRERLKGAFDAHGVVVPVLSRPMGFNPDGTPMTPGSVPPGGRRRSEVGSRDPGAAGPRSCAGLRGPADWAPWTPRPAASAWSPAPPATSADDWCPSCWPPATGSGSWSGTPTACATCRGMTTSRWLSAMPPTPRPWPGRWPASRSPTT